MMIQQSLLCWLLLLLVSQCWASVKVLRSPNHKDDKWWRNIPPKQGGFVPDSKRGHSSTIYRCCHAATTTSPTASPTTASPTTATNHTNTTMTTNKTTTNENKSILPTNHSKTKSKTTGTIQKDSVTKKTNNNNDTSTNHDPHRMLSLTNEDNKKNLLEDHEYMIVSGGFSDTDWNSFSIWALDVTALRVEEAAIWVELIGKNAAPTARMGHLSHVYNGKLYIFGGLLYNAHKGTFGMQEEMVMHRLDLTTLLWDTLPLTISSSSMDNKNDTNQEVLQKILMRGETKGGYYEEKQEWILYGGMHSYDSGRDVPLGDVWSYSFVRETWTQLSTGGLPVARTAHAATVVGSSLFVHGGLTKSYEGQPWNDVASSDIWEFDLKTKKWNTPLPSSQHLQRSYHTMVGYTYGNGNTDSPILAIFGGYKSIITESLSNEPTAYVFDGTFIAHPRNESGTWYEAIPPTTTTSGITNRFEHTAVLHTGGDMIVWGGRFQTTQQVNDGVWILNLNHALKVLATDYEFFLQQAEQDTVAALYVLVTTMMILSMLLTYICGVVTRQTNNSESSNSGLRQSRIDALPISTIQSNTDTFETPCHVCLVEYKRGDTIRTLPCQHSFHPTCVDPWLRNNASCPVCRQAISTTDSSPASTSTPEENESGITLELPTLSQSLYCRFRPSRRPGTGSSNPLFLPLPTNNNSSTTLMESTDATLT